MGRRGARREHFVHRVFVCLLKLLSALLGMVSYYLDGQIQISGPDREAEVAPWCYVYIRRGALSKTYVRLFNSIYI